MHTDSSASRVLHAMLVRHGMVTTLMQSLCASRANQRLHAGCCFLVILAGLSAGGSWPIGVAHAALGVCCHPQLPPDLSQCVMWQASIDLLCWSVCRRQLAKWRRARSFVCLLVEEAAAADGGGQPGRLLGTATLSLMQVRQQESSCRVTGVLTCYGLTTAVLP
jgi:hypothetical protein